MKEIWKDIPKYESLYQVSNIGRIKSLERKVISKKGQVFEVAEKILKPGYRCRDKNYAKVHLCRNSVVNQASVHRLVAEAFIPNVNNLPFINHKDENPKNNIVENLEWCSIEYNTNYGSANERRSKSLMNKGRSKIVKQFELSGKFIIEYPSTMEARRQTGICHIPEVCNNKRDSAGGYVWKYA